MKNLPVIRSVILRPMEVFLRESGADIEVAYRRALLPPDIVGEDAVLIPGRAVWRLLTELHYRQRIPDVGFRIASQLSVFDMPGMRDALARATTLAELLDRFIAMSHRLVNVPHYSLKKDREFLWFRRKPGLDKPGKWPMEQFVLSVMVQVVGSAMEAGWWPDRVRLIRRKPAGSAERRWLERSRVEYRQLYTSIRFPLRALHRPVVLPDNRFAGVDLPAIPDNTTEALGECLAAYLPTGRVSLEQFSEILGMSPRTLQRWLSTESTSFQQVLDAARFRAAATLLAENELDMATVSRQLGYRSQAVFSRAFRRWAGCPPSKYVLKTGSE